MNFILHLLLIPSLLAFTPTLMGQKSQLCRFHFTHTSIAVVLALGKEWLTKVVPCAKDRNDQQPPP